jgi:protein TonB
MRAAKRGLQAIWAAAVGAGLGAGFLLLSVYLLNHVLPAQQTHSLMREQILTAIHPEPVQEMAEEDTQSPPPEPVDAQDSAPDLGMFEGAAGFEYDQVLQALVSTQEQNLAQQSLRDLNETADVSKLDGLPRRLTAPPLPYPPEARRQGLEGFVTVNLLVSREGRVLKAHLIDAQPPGVFDTLVAQAALQWSFSPPTRKGEAVQVWMRQTVRFELEESLR